MTLDQEILALDQEIRALDQKILAPDHEIWALDQETSEVLTIQGDAVVLATGGAGQLWE